MPGLDPGIHIFVSASKKYVDDRDPSPPRFRRSHGFARHAEALAEAASPAMTPDENA